MINFDMDKIAKAKQKAESEKIELKSVSTPSASSKVNENVRKVEIALIQKVNANLETTVIQAFETGNIDLAGLGLKAVEIQEAIGLLETDGKGSKTRGATRDFQNNAILNRRDCLIARVYSSGNRSQATYFFVPDFSKLPDPVKEVLEKGFSAIENVVYPAQGQMSGDCWTPAVKVRFQAMAKAKATTEAPPTPPATATNPKK